MQQYSESVREWLFQDWMWLQNMKLESTLLNLSQGKKSQDL